MKNDHIDVVKSRVHNLKDVSVKIPKNTLTVITGPSGSGKSSLAFDTIYVEGQRRYIESLSSYARQFLGQFQPPDVESISGLSPAIAIDQKTASRNPRSTVGTITEIYDYFRILFARTGTLHCPDTQQVIERYTVPQVTKALMKIKNGTKIIILSPLSENFTKKQIQALGFSRVRIDGKIDKLENFGQVKGKIDLVVDRIVKKEDSTKRIHDSLEHAFKIGQGSVSVLIDDNESVFHNRNVSPVTGETFPDLEPRLFSFNSPLGACEHCKGIGILKTFDPDLLLFDDSLSLNDGAIPLLLKKNSFLRNMTFCMAKEEKVDINKPYKKLRKKFLDILYKGTTKSYRYEFLSDNSRFEFTKPYPGLVTWLDKKYHETSSERVRRDLEQYMNVRECPYCEGKRLKPIALSTKINKKSIMDFCQLPILQLKNEVDKIKFTGEKKEISSKLLIEIRSRINFLLNVGLSYLTLNRPANTLSGGESQRIRLATQIGSALSGVLYVLDEPSIGLHQHDNLKLIKTMKALRDIGNTLLVVEHDEETMRESDYIIDIGPGAGEYGGEVVACGDIKKVTSSTKSITAQYLSGKKKIETPPERRISTSFIELYGAQKNNLKNLDIKLPLGCLVCLSGLSGSGKSTLTHQVLVPAIKNQLNKTEKSRHTNYRSIKGVSELKSLIELDQSPIGRTPHSNPATYTGLLDEIRKLFSQTNEAQVRGYKPGRFSFNVKGGRCEACEGNGVKKIEMHFLPDVFITCDECHGSRYNDETLSIYYKGKNISDVLNMSISEAKDFFSNHTKMSRILTTLYDVGLGYVRLGQSAVTLSGGEAQRLKLSRELSKKPRGKCLYILDEPTTGLHFEDIKVLLQALQNLIAQGHSVLIIEHNIDVIRTADYILDLGPEGGEAGGTIIAQGTPEEVAQVKISYTGQYLKKFL